MSSKHLNDYIDYCFACGFSDATIKGKKCVIKLFSRRVKNLTRAKIHEITDFLAETKNEYTRLSRHQGLKQFFKWLEQENRILFNPMKKLDTPKISNRIPKHIMSKGETERYLNAYSEDLTNPREFRNRTMLELMYTCSLRRSEIVRLDLEDFDPDQKILKIHKTKNRNGRVVPVGTVACKLLETYIRELRPKYGEKALFLGLNNPAKPKRLKASFVTEIGSNARKRSKIRTKATSHSLRKSSATHMLRNGATIHSVKELLGHLNLSSTMPYTKVTANDLAKMQSTFHPRERQKNIILPEFTIDPTRKLRKNGHTYPLKST